MEDNTMRDQDLYEMGGGGLLPWHCLPKNVQEKWERGAEEYEIQMNRMFNTSRKLPK